jgi:phage-related protein
MGVIMFGGVSSRDVGIEVETFPTYDIPEREFEVFHVPGRNGDIIIDSGTYKNIDRTYEISIATYNTSYHQKMAAVARWLCSSPGYYRLEDSYEPDFFRYAYYKDPLNIENIFNEAGKATITFVCKPQKYLKSGEFPIVFDTNGKMKNPTNQIALPLIEVTTDNTDGAVTISDGDYSCTFRTIANKGTNFILDCELQDVYWQQTGKNDCISFTSGYFPALQANATMNITLSGGVQEVKITPRWWTV